MNSAVSSSTFVGAGSFRCRECDYTLTLSSSDELGSCPSCGSTDFVRASLFSTERISAPRDEERPDAALVEPAGAGR